MRKYFNINGICYPEEHYMVDLRSRMAEIRNLIDKKQYFVINRARQYGKTTLLNQLAKYLSDQYTVFFISFEGLGDTAFENESSFCRTVCSLMYDTVRYGEVADLPEAARNILKTSSEEEGSITLPGLSELISEICRLSDKKVILMIDEVDQASNRKVFLDFLGMLRSKYLKRSTRPVFQSVILAGVYDIKNLKLRIREDREHKYNSPWNIAADFSVDMSFTVTDIRGMLSEYKQDTGCEMNLDETAEEIFEYTSGYPYLVSKICKLIDENADVKQALLRSGLSYQDRWSRQGVAAAVQILLKESNTLFDDMRKKIEDYPEVKTMLYAMLFRGEAYPYNPDHFAIDLGTMFGFIRECQGQAVVSNRIFETRLYNLFLSEEMTESAIYQTGEREKNQFVENGRLNMEMILQKFMLHFHDVYRDVPEKFIEDSGRRMFLLYLKPIINGTGNYYIEAQTRDQTRTDIIVDYLGAQYVIELKIWHGDEYNRRGEKQLAEYLDYYHLNRGYMLSFNFNKKKKTGIREIRLGNKTIYEVVV